MNFNRRLKELRTNMGLTQADLASELGLSRAAVAGYENSGKEPTYDLLIKIANYFGVTTDDLLGVKQNKAVSKKKDLVAIIDDAVKEYGLVVPKRGRTPQKSFSSLLVIILANAEKVGIEADVIDLLVGVNTAIENIVSDAKECYTWLPDEFFEYDLESSFHYSLSMQSYTKTPHIRDLLDEYPPEMIRRLRANDFRSSTQAAISNLTKAVDDFTRVTYENLMEGKPPRKKGDTDGDGAKEGK